MAAKTLTKAEEFYIEHNMDKTDAELAKDLGRNVSLVQEHIHKTKGAGRINKLLIREKGCVVMTAGASEAADQARKGYVSEEAIQAAVARGDYEEAARLQKANKEQKKETEKAATQHSKKYIHYIHGEPRDTRR